MIKFKDLYVCLAPPGKEKAETRLPGIPPVLPIINSTDGCIWGIGHLKEFLAASLNIAESLENEAGPGPEPQTVAEIEVLEEKLKGALEELRIRKAELKNEAA